MKESGNERRCAGEGGDYVSWPAVQQQWPTARQPFVSIAEGMRHPLRIKYDWASSQPQRQRPWKRWAPEDVAALFDYHIYADEP